MAVFAASVQAMRIWPVIKASTAGHQVFVRVPGY
jgi:hypothetical protein